MKDFYTVTEAAKYLEKQEAEMKRLGMVWPTGDLKRCFACPKCGTLRIEAP